MKNAQQDVFNNYLHKNHAIDMGLSQGAAPINRENVPYKIYAMKNFKRTYNLEKSKANFLFSARRGGRSAYKLQPLYCALRNARRACKLVQALHFI